MTTFEVHLAIYDLSMGMAKNLSASFLGPQHAVDIIPHTAIVAFGKEYFFGQGIEWCNPHEFRATRGIHPIEIQPLGHTTCTQQQFEDWCRAQAANGNFGVLSYDLFHKNCNNFSEEAARQGLRLQMGVPQYILELPHKVLASPMGMMMRPMLEQMQITNTAPTNTSNGASMGGTFGSTQSPPAPAATPVPAANPWANIPAATSTTAPHPSAAKETSKPVGTHLLDKQTALLSTDTGVVKTCVNRLKPDEDIASLLTKLGDAKASWSQEDINTLNTYLRLVIESDTSNASFALMLLRLLVLKQPFDADTTSACNGERSQTTQLVAKLLIEEKLSSMAACSMAWCALSNAIGSTQPRDWNVSAGNEGYNFNQVVDLALSDSDPSKDGASSPSHISLRQSAAAFLYNSSRHLTIGNGESVSPDKSSDPSESMMSILLGCLEHLSDETDVTVMQRLYMAVGQLLKSSQFGETAVSLVKDLGLVDDNIASGKGCKEVEGLAREVACLLK